MQYDENAEKYGYEGEMTPMKCDELQAYKGDVTIPVYGTIADAEVYLKKDVDAAIAELKEKLMPCLNGDCILTCEVIEKYGKENAELKAKLEDVQASMYADVVDANMENRRLRRTLWLARAERAKDRQQLFHFSLDFPKLCIDGFYDPYSGRRELSPKQWIKVFNKVEIKCLKKAEEYK